MGIGREEEEEMKERLNERIVTGEKEELFMIPIRLCVSRGCVWV
jgi:hypothetical protein